MPSSASSGVGGGDEAEMEVCRQQHAGALERRERRPDAAKAADAERPYPVSEEMWNSEDDAHDVSDTPPKVRRETSSRDVVDGRTPPKVRRESKEDLPVLAAVALEEKSEAPPKARKPQRSVRILPAAMNA